MKAPDFPPDERSRIANLHALDILDTPPEERFDRLTRLARRMFSVPIALVSLVDSNRQWFKSCMGLDVSETPRDISFCGHAILGNDILLIPDASADERFFDNPLVLGEPNIRFYAGCPLRTGNNSKIGTLCLIDSQPHDFGPEELQLLRDLAAMAEQELAAIQLATTDMLTSLSNRRGFEVLSQQVIHLCQRMGRSASLLFFDLNHFKEINDNFGHCEGDLALETFAEALREVFRESDVIGRLGGDEFVVLLTGTEGDVIEAVLQRLQTRLDEVNQLLGRGYDIAFSVGEVAFNPERHQHIALLLAEADAAMYADKKKRKASLP